MDVCGSKVLFFFSLLGDLHIKFTSFMKQETEERACLTYFLPPLPAPAPAGQPSLPSIASAAGAMLPALGQSGSRRSPPGNRPIPPAPALRTGLRSPPSWVDGSRTNPGVSLTRKQRLLRKRLGRDLLGKQQPTCKAPSPSPSMLKRPPYIYF